MPMYRGVLMARAYVEVDALDEDEATVQIMKVFNSNDGYAMFPQPDVVILEKPEGGFANALIAQHYNQRAD